MSKFCFTWLSLCGAAAVAGAAPVEKLPAVKALMAPGAPIETAVAGTNGWVEIDYLKDIEKGSALDFSGWGLLDGPAGKFGRVVARNGHFEFEKKPGAPQRFYGANVCFSMCFPSAEETDRLLTRFERLGYNTFRLHHYDCVLAKPQFQPHYRPESRTNALDMIDRLVAEAGKRGFYLTIDLFTVRQVTWRDCGIDRDGEMHRQTYKIMVGCHEGTYRDWERFARLVLTHRNPYNGLTWAEDPAIAFVDLVNEGCIPLGGSLEYVRAHRFGGKPRIEEEWLDNPIVLGAWAKWLAAKRAEKPGYAPDAVPERLPLSVRDPAAMAFVCDMERRLVTRQKKFLAAIGCKALVTSNNNGGRDFREMQQVAEELYDYRDTHFYHDHSQGLSEQEGLKLPLCYRMTSPFSGTQSLRMECAAFARVPGMPFTLTEYDFPVPSPYRSSGIIMTAALASLQDWDGVWHFAYSHNLMKLNDGYGTPAGYDLAGDAVGQMADRMFIPVFLRRDVKPLAQAWAIDMSNATAGNNPRDEEWRAAPNVSPLPGWSWQEAVWRVRIGTTFGTPAGWKGIAREKLETPSGLLPLETFAADPQFDIRRKPFSNQHFALASPASCAGCSKRHRDVITAGPLSFRIGRAAATVACTSLDGEPVTRSGRLLVMHLTDSLGTGTRFVRATNDKDNVPRVIVLNWGDFKKPILVKDGEAAIDLALEKPDEYEVYALATSGKRLEKVPSSAAGGKLRFTARVKGPDGKARLAYEVAKVSGTCGKERK